MVEKKSMFFSDEILVVHLKLFSLMSIFTAESLNVKIMANKVEIMCFVVIDRVVFDFDQKWL